MSQSSQQKLLALATVAIIALLGLSAFLIYTKINQDKLMKGQSSELIQQTNSRLNLKKNITRLYRTWKKCGETTVNLML
jgi:hypothetical protein